jgi:brefeldin A-inhibited guanine nucleotide-exchange protein
LSELSFDARPDIRKNALGVFLGTLRSHGHLFTLGLWERVYGSVLFPIFDSDRRAMDSLSQRLEAKGIDSEQRVVRADAWHYETCSLSSELMIELFVRFYEVMNPLVGKILNQFVEYIKPPHQNLATISVTVVVRLICSAGTLFSEDRWSEVLSAFKDAAVGTLPDLIKITEIVDLLMARQNLTKVGHYETVTELKNRLQFSLSEVKSQTEVQLVLIQVKIILRWFYFGIMFSHSCSDSLQRNRMDRTCFPSNILSNNSGR